MPYLRIQSMHLHVRTHTILWALRGEGHKSLSIHAGTVTRTQTSTRGWLLDASWTLFPSQPASPQGTLPAHQCLLLAQNPLTDHHHRPQHMGRMITSDKCNLEC